jgi:FlaG/FlaF family flagellin (archaellin)
VSPVIGVILVVALTLIIAAAIGASAFGLAGSLSESPPQATIDAEHEDRIINDGEGHSAEMTIVTLTHEGGDNIDKDNINVTINGEPAWATPDPPEEYYEWEAYDYNHIVNPWETTESDQISSGDQTVIAIKTNEIVESNNPTIDRTTFSFDDGGINLWEPIPTVTYDLNKVELESGDTVRMIWESGDTSTPLVEYEIK